MKKYDKRIHISPAQVIEDGKHGTLKGIEARVKVIYPEHIGTVRTTVYLGHTPKSIAHSLETMGVEEVSHSSSMEFATEYGWDYNGQAEVLFENAWSIYESNLALKEKNAKALKQFNRFSDDYSPYGAY